jgi:hypothetical protein
MDLRSLKEEHERALKVLQNTAEKTQQAIEELRLQEERYIIVIFAY